MAGCVTSLSGGLTSNLCKSAALKLESWQSLVVSNLVKLHTPQSSVLMGLELT